MSSTKPYAAIHLSFQPLSHLSKKKKDGKRSGKLDLHSAKCKTEPHNKSRETGGDRVKKL